MFVFLNRNLPGGVTTGSLIPITGLFLEEGDILQQKQPLNATINRSSAISFAIASPPAHFHLRSVALSGSFTGNGSFKVYIEDAQGARFLAADSDLLDIKGSTALTGMVVADIAAPDGENNSQESVNSTITPETLVTNTSAQGGIENLTSETNSTAANVSELAVNASQAAITIINDTSGGINASAPAVHQTSSQDPTHMPDGNGTVQEPAALAHATIIGAATNATSAANASTPQGENITLIMRYNDGTGNDPDNDGVESASGVVDFTVAASQIPAEMEPDNLCTLWEVVSQDTGEGLRTCHGAQHCCTLASLVSVDTAWYSPLEIYKGRYGATENNVVRAALVYANYSLSNDAYADIQQTGWQERNASFLSNFIGFADACVDTCLLPPGFQDANFTFVVEIEGNGTLQLSETSLALRNVSDNAAIVVGRVKEDPTYNVTIDRMYMQGKNFVVELHHNGPRSLPIEVDGDVEFSVINSRPGTDEPATVIIHDYQDQYFRIKVGDHSEVLAFGTPKTVGIQTDIKNRDGRKVDADIALVDSMLDTVVVKTENASLDVKVKEGTYRLDVTPNNNPVKSIQLNEVRLFKNASMELGLDEPDVAGAVQSYAVDPASLNFTNGTMTITAQGIMLRKCKDWDFSMQACMGNWTVARDDLVPGQNYTVTLSADDPAWFEGTADTGGSSNSLSVSTGVVTAVAGDLYLAAVSSKPDVAVTSVDGLGLAWALVKAQCAGRGQTRVEVWQAQGVPSGNGIVTANLSSAPKNAVIAVSHYSNASQANPIGNVTSANTNGVDGACTGGTDSSAVETNLTTTASNAVGYGAAAVRLKTFTPGSGFTERATVTQGASGDMAGLAVEDAVMASPSSIAIDGALSGSTDWAIIGIEINPVEGLDTVPPGQPVNITAVMSFANITWNWTNPSDADFDHVEVYVDGGWVANDTRSGHFLGSLAQNTSHSIKLVAVDTSGNNASPVIDARTTTLQNASMPNMTLGTVTPSAGYASTIFSYTVSYTDPNNGTPQWVYVSIDGTNHTMVETQHSDSDTSDGKTYNYSIQLSEGAHNFTFFAADMMNTTAHTSTQAGPQVNANITTLSLTPTADARIKQGSAGNNFGSEGVMKIDADSEQRLLVKVNLTAIPAGATIANATLSLYMSSAGSGSKAVQGTIHRLTRAWVEGTKSGSGTADGVTWNSYDGVNAWSSEGGDYDGVIYAMRILNVTGWYTWNITALVQEWVDGTAPNYGLIMLASGNVTTKTFRTHDYSNADFWPNLTILYSVSSADTTSPSISAVGASGITHSSATVNWSTNEASNSSISYGTTLALGASSGSGAGVIAHSMTLLSLINNTLYHYNVTSCDASGNCATAGPYNFTTDQFVNMTRVILVASADTRLKNGTSGAADTNFGGSTSMRIDADQEDRLAIKIDLAPIPQGSTIVNATLYLRSKSVGVGSQVVTGTIHRFTRAWVEGTRSGSGTADGATWNSYDGVNAWSSEGGDYDAAVWASTDITSTGVYSWDMTDLVSAWIDGAYPNNGLIMLASGNTSYKAFKTRDTSTSSNRPNLTVNYLVGPPDTTAPGMVQDLTNRSIGYTYAYWNWTNPDDYDFSEALIYVDGNNVANTTGNFYNATGLSSGLSHTIEVRTVDVRGNVDVPGSTHTVMLPSIIPAVFNLAPVAGLPLIRGAAVKIAANVTAAIAVDAVMANITLPNASITQVILARANATDRYNASFVMPNLSGRYNITLIANDTANHVNASQSTYFIALPDTSIVIDMITPASNRSVEYESQFLVTARVRCVGAANESCGNASVALDPSRDDLESGTQKPGWVFLLLGVGIIAIFGFARYGRRFLLMALFLLLVGCSPLIQGVTQPSSAMVGDIITITLPILSQGSTTLLPAGGVEMPNGWQFINGSYAAGSEIHSLSQGISGVSKLVETYGVASGNEWLYFVGDTHQVSADQTWTATLNLHISTAGEHRLRYAVGTVLNGTLSSMNVTDYATINVVDKGLIPVAFGRPFYVDETNPRSQAELACLASMVGGSECNVTWTVHVNETLGSYTFFANVSTDLPLANRSGNITISVFDDLTPPSSISFDKNVSSFFNFTFFWTNPPDPDFNHTEVYINDVWLANTTATNYTVTDLHPNVEKTIKLVPVDNDGNKGEALERELKTERHKMSLEMKEDYKKYKDYLTGKKNVSLEINASLDIDHCLFYADGALIRNMTGVTPGQNISVELNFTTGEHNWSTSCVDIYGETVSSDTYEMRMRDIKFAEFDGETTDLAAMALDDIPDFVLDRSGYGRMHFLERLNLSGDFNFDDYVELAENHARINTSMLSVLNTTATITLYNVSLSNPVVRYDPEDDGTYVDCPSDVCVNATYDADAKTLNFTVLHFTTYAGGESAVSTSSSAASFTQPGNAVSAQLVEDAAPITSDGVPARPATCRPTWSCREWGSCIAGKQSRTCADVNGCGVSGMPRVERECVAVCVPQWDCGAWSKCVSGSRSRTCVDHAACPVPSAAPPSQEHCAALPPATSGITGHVGASFRYRGVDLQYIPVALLAVFAVLRLLFFIRRSKPRTGKRKGAIVAALISVVLLALSSVMVFKEHQVLNGVTGAISLPLSETSLPIAFAVIIVVMQVLAASIAALYVFHRRKPAPMPRQHRHVLAWAAAAVLVLLIAGVSGVIFAPEMLPSGITGAVALPLPLSGTYLNIAIALIVIKLVLLSVAIRIISHRGEKRSASRKHALACLSASLLVFSLIVLGIVVFLPQALPSAVTAAVVLPLDDIRQHAVAVMGLNVFLLGILIEHLYQYGLQSQRPGKGDGKKMGKSVSRRSE